MNLRSKHSRAPDGLSTSFRSDVPNPLLAAQQLRRIPRTAALDGLCGASGQALPGPGSRAARKPSRAGEPLLPSG